MKCITHCIIGIFMILHPTLLRAEEAAGAADKAYKAGNYKEAYRLYGQLLAAPGADHKTEAAALTSAAACLQQLGRSAELDQFLEENIKSHAGNSRMLDAAAKVYQSAPHEGYMIAGKFTRGSAEGGGRYVYSLARDARRAFQLKRQAMDLVVQADLMPDEAADFFLDFAALIQGGAAGYGSGWQLQELSDLSFLPDYDENWPGGRGSMGAPVDSEGQPVFYHVPQSFESAKSDGERWRWLLDRAEKKFRRPARPPPNSLLRSFSRVNSMLPPSRPNTLTAVQVRSSRSDVLTALKPSPTAKRWQGWPPDRGASSCRMSSILSRFISTSPPRPRTALESSFGPAGGCISKPKAV